jgi:hypothetical protein
MKCILWTLLLGACVLGAGPVAAGAGEPKSERSERVDRYAVPQGDVAELVKFVSELAAFRPTTPEEDAEHRAKFRPVLQQAADSILRLDKAPASEACQIARFVLLANRVHWLAQTSPAEQRKTIADVETYLAEKLKEGQACAEVAEMAYLAAQTLQNSGRWDLAAGAYKTFVGMLEKSDDRRLSQLAQRMAASHERLVALSKDLPPREAVAISPRGRLVPLDLTGKFNWRSVDVSDGNFHGNGIAELPKGEPALGGVKFRTSDEFLQLGCPQLPSAPVAIAGIPVNRKVARLYFLHAVQYGSPNRVKEGARIGEYRMQYQDGSDDSLPLAFGQDVRDWWIFDEGKPVTRGQVVWTGANPGSERARRSIRLYLGVWQNPHPDRPVAQLDFVAEKDGPCAPFCFAITAEE